MPPCFSRIDAATDLERIIRAETEIRVFTGKIQSQLSMMNSSDDLATAFREGLNDLWNATIGAHETQCIDRLQGPSSPRESK